MWTESECILMEGRIIVVQKCQAILPNMKNEANSGYNPVIKYGNQMAAGMKLGMNKLPRESLKQAQKGQSKACIGQMTTLASLNGMTQMEDDSLLLSAWSSWRSESS